MKKRNEFKCWCVNFFLSLSVFCASFFIAWQLSATTNFFYSDWYEVLDLGQAISKYSPKNKFKHGFENTNKQQHVDLFAGIVDGIQDDGNGLKNLSYTDIKTKESNLLLTEAEVIHLQDVSNLVSKIKLVGVVALMITALLFLIMRKNEFRIVKIKAHLFGGMSIIIALVILVFVIGPIEVFYLGHEWVFPNNHQWFFYYEESLMSTMMKAPVLFGPIACQLVVLTIILWIFLIYVLRKFE